VLIKTYQQAL